MFFLVQFNLQCKQRDHCSGVVLEADIPATSPAREHTARGGWPETCPHPVCLPLCPQLSLKKLLILLLSPIIDNIKCALKTPLYEPYGALLLSQTWLHAHLTPDSPVSPMMMYLKRYA